MFSQDDPQTLSRSLRYFGYFNRAAADKIGGFRQTVSAIDQNQNVIRSQRSELDEHYTTLEQENVRLSGLSQQRLHVLSKLEGDIKNKSSLLKQKETDRRELEKIISGLDGALADIVPPHKAVPFIQRKGKLVWPSSGQVSRSFGSSQEIGPLKYDGMIITNQAGSPVVAAHHGRVVFADWLRGYGLLLIIDHGDGYMTLYGRNRALYKELGDWVQVGEVIGQVGSTGVNDNESALYFALRYKGKPSNPRPWLAARK